jgi:hypothetical protein
VRTCLDRLQAQGVIRPCDPGIVTEVNGSPTSSAAAPASTLGAGSLPAQASEILPTFPAFYDAHKDVIVVSDAYPKAAAGTFHANYAPSLGVVKPASQPAWYIVRGLAAHGQLVVLGSEPGETTTRRCGRR